MQKIRELLKVRGVFCLVVMFLFIIAGTIFTINKAFAQDAAASISKLSPEAAKAAGWAFMTAAISVSVGSFSAAIALAYIGSAAMGAISEKPEVAGKAIIFAGLAEGVAIYGLIIAIMILAKV